MYVCMHACMYVCMYVYRVEAGGSPEGNWNSLCSILKNVIFHCVLQCFVLFQYLVYVVRCFNLFLSFSSSSTYIIFVFPIGIVCFLKFQVSFDGHKHVIIHQRTMGEMHMGLFSLHIRKAVLEAFISAHAPFTLCRWHFNASSTDWRPGFLWM